MRTALLAGACALALSAAACTPGSLTSADVASLTNAAANTAPTLPPDASVPAVLTNAGVTPAAQATVATNIARVQVAAANICKFRPLASGILNVAIAASSDVATVANSSVGLGVRGVATIICDGLTTAPTYTSFGNRKGELIRAVVSVNGLTVPIYGTRLR
jgi:hypothetical protein